VYKAVCDADVQVTATDHPRVEYDSADSISSQDEDEDDDDDLTATTQWYMFHSLAFVSAV